MQLITTTDALAEACRRLRGHSYVAVDTEFMREQTYYPELCLIQLASPVEELLVDPLSERLDLGPFLELMADHNVLKVFHAARQDLEIVYLKSGQLPEPLFDTQVAAMVCGFGDSISFMNLAKKIAGVDIDKSSQFTDWSRRPLSEKQLRYALGDVVHLRPIYERLADDLERSGRAEWLDEEMSGLMAHETYRQHPEEAWQRLKLRVKSRKALGVLMEVAEWRERSAQTQNVPRGRILKDDAIYDIANQMPQSIDQLQQLRSIHDGFSRSQRGREIVEAVKRGLDRDPRTLPQLDRAKPVPPEANAVLELLKVLLKAVAAEHQVAARLIASSEDLEAIAISDKADVAALTGWRRELFGEAALKLKSGRLGLVIRGGQVNAVEV
ncbi:MAG: ribonuclease D [Hyphomicrobiaceae bacterium]